MTHRLQLIHCLTPLHNGAGEGLGALDRPLIRESATGWPFIQSSTLKGAWKAVAKSQALSWVPTGFGPDKNDASSNQGWLLFTDASLFWFPVQSLAGTMAWVTCPLALARFARFAEMAGNLRSVHEQAVHLSRGIAVIRKGQALGGTDDAVLRVGDRYLLGQFLLDPFGNDALRNTMTQFVSSIGSILFPNNNHQDANPYWASFFPPRCLVVHDDDFREITQRATEQEANISILQDKGVTEEGSLRYTEYLPSETVLFSLLTDQEVGSKNNLLGEFILLTNHKVIQIGGDESKGKGLCRWFFVGENA